ncbi:MAG: LysR substrate-binding domain-containing protein [Oceanospirillaceae bacterium]
MRDFLPPMQALRSFESAARFHSISKAAIELSVTQGAVSKQIKLLESFLGTALFTRTAKGITLTNEGQCYLNTVIKVLNELNSSGELLQAHPKQQKLLLDVIPSMSNLWLIPKIHSFEKQYSHIEVDLINGDGQPNFNTSQADIAIRCLLPESAIGNEVELFSERLLLVAAPKLLHTKRLESPADIFQHRLLQQNTRPTMWQSFLRQNHLLTSDIDTNFGMGFQHFFMTLKAAEEGLGVALIPDFLAVDAISQGKLINPFQLEMPSTYRYYLFSPSYKLLLPKVQEFILWLTKQLST